MKILGIVSMGGMSGGGHSYFFRALAKFHDVRVLNVKLSGFSFLLSSLHAFYPSLDGNFPYSFFPYEKNIWSFKKKTQLCEREIKKLAWKPNIIFQLGSWLLPMTGENTAPYALCLFLDSTSKMAEREYPPWAKYRSRNEKTIG